MFIYKFSGYFIVLFPPASFSSSILFILLTPSIYCIIQLTSCPFLYHISQSRALFLLLASSIQPMQNKLNYLSFCFFVIRSLKTRTSSKNLHILSCLVQLKSVLLIFCVLDLFAECWQSILFQKKKKKLYR